MITLKAMTYEDLKGKKVLVTGASSGIGLATAVSFSKQGCFVGVHYFRTEDGANAILFLASEAASFITGEYIAVNGGLLMRA